MSILYEINRCLVGNALTPTDVNSKLFQMEIFELKCF